MRLALVVVLAGLSVAITAAMADDLVIPDVTYPTLPPKAASKEGFVPQGWKLETAVSGDLDGDGVADLALVLHATDPANIVDNKGGLGESSLDTNPRILAVAFARPGGYELALQNHTLIPRRTDPVLDDPLAGDPPTIRRGVLKIPLFFFASAGGWTTSTVDYTFRLENRRFVMIGYDRSDTQHNTGVTTAVSIDYLSRKMQTATGRIDSDEDKDDDEDDRRAHASRDRGDR